MTKHPPAASLLPSARRQPLRPMQLVNPLTGQIPVSRKERREFEEMMKKASNEKPEA